VKKLKGSDDLYRVRVGDYRIIYRIDEKGRLVVLVIRVSRRDQAY
jgi:mRNA interferase RelE/StbE